MPDQKAAFQRTEGDRWFERNRDHADSGSDLIVDLLKGIGARPKSILEIGCSAGGRLQALHGTFGAACHGIDPSHKAIETGQSRYPAITLQQGTADNLPYADHQFDLVVLGFCLYLCDPFDHFRIAWQCDRVLQDRGFLIINDFHSLVPLKTEYEHAPTLYSYKMEWSRMFTWHPAYKLLSRLYREHSTPYSFDADEHICIDLLQKNEATAFPLRARNADQNRP
jgi:ubiquinone/menaquinone biosynthesis C-methylase UbiE